jgi:hypothetical protein
MPRPISVDFTGVEVGFSSVRIPEGDYGLKIMKVVQKKAQSSGNPCLVFALKTISGPKAGLGKTIPHNCTLTKASLWNLRNLLEATGKQIPSKALKIDLDKLIGLTLAGTAVDGEFEGKKKTDFAAFFPIADLNPEPEEGGEAVEGEEELEGGEESAEESEEAEELFE